jgi:DNA-binding CsgD family transcriptional regulator
MDPAAKDHTWTQATGRVADGSPGRRRRDRCDPGGRCSSDQPGFGSRAPPGQPRRDRTAHDDRGYTKGRSDPAVDTLTAREREVLALLAQGLTDRGIGEHLWLTRKTVETHIRHILAKLNIPDGPQHNRRVLATVVYLHAKRNPDAVTTAAAAP